jgi:gluconate 2-dehydrogenase alpha chain
MSWRNACSSIRTAIPSTSGPAQRADVAATKLKETDVVVVGVGLTGSILAKELADAGLKVVGLERGPMRDTDPDFAMPNLHDELRYIQRHELMQDLSQETLTFRNSMGETALPMRQFGSFLLGDGVGGSAAHWTGVAWRLLPWDFETRTRTIERYGKQWLPPDCTSQDWGIGYDELEPYFDRFERVYGICGKAGNLRGRIQPGGNPFEGPRSAEYPNPPLKRSYSNTLVAEAASQLGYKPFPLPSAAMSRGYTNPYGVSLGACVYCGYCERFGCEMGAKASPQTTVLPALMGSGNFELRTLARVVRLKLDSTGRHAVGVTYVDSRGRELEQPAQVVLLTSYALSNVRLMLLSGIGRPYDPLSGEGVVGKNYTYQCNSSVTLFFEDKVFNQFMGAGPMGIGIDELDGDNFDHSKLGFMGGAAVLSLTNGARPIEYHPVPAGTPRWGSAWKKAVARYYNRSFRIGSLGGVQAYRTNYLDLDPTYRDALGLPLLRMTFDFHENEYKLSEFVTAKMHELAKRINPAATIAAPRKGKYDIVPYQTTHNTGGAIMGPHAGASALNKYLQSWDVPNVFVVGANAFPQNSGAPPTATLGALTYWVADAIKNRYVKSPGLLG